MLAIGRLTCLEDVIQRAIRGRELRTGRRVLGGQEVGGQVVPGHDAQRVQQGVRELGAGLAGQPDAEAGLGVRSDGVEAEGTY